MIFQKISLTLNSKLKTMKKTINRYELITLIIKENYLSESDREFIANLSDSILLNSYGKQQFKVLRKGFYILN